MKKLTCDLVPYYFNRATGEVTWNTPDELRSSADRGDGATWAWLPDAAEGWVACRSLGGGAYETAEGAARTLKRNEKALPLDKPSLSRVHGDLVLLDSLDEGLMLHNLRVRFLRDEIYTGVGDIVVALNPFKRLPLYGSEVIDAYNRAGNKPMPAHPYKLAKAAVGALVEDATRNQSILVSGESGAGKTEATKQCLSFLAEVAGSSGDIEQRVLGANPILEAFGNAKTTRNDNSSRFGRFSELQLDARLRIAGAKVTNYLLEKSRVKGQSDDERNYHAFYQLCAAPVGARDYGVGDAGSYGYLRKCLEVRGIDDGADYDDVADATASLGFDDAQRSTVWGLVAGILKLGQVGFAALDGMSDGSAVDGGSAAVLAEVAAHLGVDGAQLGDALTHRTLSIRGQDDMAVPLREAQALENRDALSKYAYDHLFDWLVGRVNAALRAADADVACFIGILDIFGFEIFTLNSFEQLCINFTNEKLQQLFNEHTFKTEAATYEREGVPFPPIDFVDNQPICDLIEKRGGILTLLDDTVKGPGKPEQKDAKFSQNLDQACRANAFFVPANDHRGVRGAVFSVKHYAGTVCYSCDGFVEKNADTLYKDLYDCLSASGNGLIAAMFPPLPKEVTKRATLGGAFRKQLSALMETLRSTDPHYIRCVKPNQPKRARLFEGAAVLEQLRCAGVFEATAIRKQGYPFRFEYARFVVRYKSIMSTGAGWVPFASTDDRQRCEEILAATKQKFPGLQRGKTMLLFRADEYRVLELCRALAADRVSAKIQAKARGALTRRYVEKVKVVRPTLRRALEAGDLESLEAALRATDEALGVFAQFEVSVPIAEWAACKEKVLIIKEAARLALLLEHACEPDDETLLEDDAALSALMRVLDVDCAELAAKGPCVEPTFDQWHTYATQRFHERREAKLGPKFATVLQTLERDDMAELYASAKQFGYEHAGLAEIESLLGASEEQLLKRQYARAHQNGDAGRAMGKEIALKELYLDNYAALFTFEKFALLRDPDEYAAAGGFLAGHRKEKADTMLTYSTHKLLTSLTALDPKLKKDALRANRNIMGFMGEKQGRTRVIQRRFNVSVQRARVLEKASTLRDRSER